MRHTSASRRARTSGAGGPSGRLMGSRRRRVLAQWRAGPCERSLPPCRSMTPSTVWGSPWLQTATSTSPGSSGVSESSACWRSSRSAAAIPRKPPSMAPPNPDAAPTAKRPPSPSTPSPGIATAPSARPASRPSEAPAAVPISASWARSSSSSCSNATCVGPWTATPRCSLPSPKFRSSDTAASACHGWQKQQLCDRDRRVPGSRRPVGVVRAVS
jgi:hypothetical protein